MKSVFSRTIFTMINTRKNSVTASAFFALVLTACQPSAKTSSLDEMTREEASALGAKLGREAAKEYKAKPNKLSTAEARKCANDGGTVRQDSLLGKEHCDFSMRLSDTERSNCKAKGGAVWYSALGDMEYCKILPTDIGKACTKSTDCQEACLSETRQCSALPPIGLSVLDEDGNVMEGPIE